MEKRVLEDLNLGKALISSDGSPREPAEDPTKSTCRGDSKKIPDKDALRECVDNFGALADTANDGILIVTGDDVFVYANQRIAEITGHNIDTLCQFSFQDLVLPHAPM